ncbi:MAG: CoA transferase [Methylocystis sp.]
MRQGDAAPVPFTPAAGRPLDRLRVLDFTHVVAGPTIGKLLAEHGADVIHCRNPYLDHILGFDIDTSFGKKTAYIDLRADADRARALDLARDCDVFVQGFRWGSLAKRGFRPQELWRINPRLVYVEVNAYGFQGPWAERRGWEQLAQAATGLAAKHSAELGEPALIPAYFNDYGSGCLGALGVLSALLRPRRGRRSLDCPCVACEDGHARHAFRRQRGSARSHQPGRSQSLSGRSGLPARSVDAGRAGDSVGENPTLCGSRRKLSGLLDARHRVGT